MQINQLWSNKRTSGRESDVPHDTRNQFGTAVARQPLCSGYAETIADPALTTLPNVRTSPKPILPNIIILSVSPVEEDHVALQYAFSQRSYWTRYSRGTWTLSVTDTVVSAVTIIQQTNLPIVLCERDLPDGSWKNVLSEISRLSDAPYLIVTSKFADDYLWAEALNMGAYDVLAKPFDVAEVARSLGLAWLHWNYRHEIAPNPRR